MILDQDRAEQVSPQQSVGIGQEHRNASDNQERAKHRFRYGRKARVSDAAPALAGTMEIGFPRRKRSSKGCVRDRPLDRHEHRHDAKHLRVRNCDARPVCADAMKHRYSAALIDVIERLGHIRPRFPNG